MIDSLRQRHPDLLLIDGGDWSEFGAIQSKSLAMFRGLQAMKYDVVALGRRELSTSLWDSLNSRGKMASELMLGNVRPGKGAMPSALRLLERGGSKVAVISAWTENKLNLGSNYEILPSENFLREQLPKAQSADVRVVILYGNNVEATALAAKFPEVDAWLLAGGTGRVMASASAANNALLVGPGDRGRELGLVAIEKSAERNARRADFKAVILGNWVKESPAAKAIIESSRPSSNGGAAKPSGTNHVESRFVGNGSCRLCHEEIYNNWQATLHAKALHTLEGKKENSNPKCLACHTTGYGQASGYGNALEGAELGGVGCEACHGRAETHLLKDDAKLTAISEATCRACHTTEASPKFVFAEYVKRVH